MKRVAKYLIAFGIYAAMIVGSGLATKDSDLVAVLAFMGIIPLTITFTVLRISERDW